MLRLSLRILPLFATVVALAMALGAYMNFSGVRSAYVDLIETRMQLVAQDVATVVEAAVSVGIAASEQVTLPILLERQVEADELIEVVRLVDPNGVILFASNAEAPEGETAPSESSLGLIDQAIINDFGVTVARVQVLYDQQRPDAAMAGFGQSILTDAIPISAAALLLGSIAAFLILTLLHRRAMQAVVDHPDDPFVRAQTDLDKAISGDKGADP